jgi:hypothetical protein
VVWFGAGGLHWGEKGITSEILLLFLGFGTTVNYYIGFWCCKRRGCVGIDCTGLALCLGTRLTEQGEI